MVKTNEIRGLNVFQTINILTSNISANSGYQSVYRLEIKVEKGDILVIKTQIEATNDYKDAVSLMVGIAINSNIMSSFSENVLVTTNHHLPIQSEYIHLEQNRQVLKIEAMLSASRCDASPNIIIEYGYGFLIVEKYSNFACSSDFISSGAVLLQTINRQYNILSKYFGVDYPYIPTVALESDIKNIQKGDLIQVFGQALSSYLRKIEMHGQRVTVLFNKKMLLNSVYSSTNSYPISPDVSLNNYVVSYAYDNYDSLSIQMELNGVNGGGLEIQGGHLYTLVSKVKTSGFSLTNYYQLFLNTQLNIIANTPSLDILSTTIGISKLSYIRINTHIQFVYPQNYELGISCAIQIIMSSFNYNDASPIISKYIVKELETMQIKMEYFSFPLNIGSYKISTRVYCLRQDASPTVVVAGNSLLQISVFSQYSEKNNFLNLLIE